MAVIKIENRPALTVQNVGIRLFRRNGILGSRSFSHWALEDVSFDVRRGEVFGVIGRNGAGKTSLLRVLANIFEPDRGVVRTHGLRACLLGLQTGFINDLTGRENAILSGMLLGKTKQEMISCLPEIEAFSELGSWMEQPLSTYSSGMSSRLGFAVSAHTQADIILIDEALTVGDQGFRTKSKEKIEELLASGRTVVLVSHNAGAIEGMTQRAVWIERGRSVLCGDSKDVAAAYQKFTDYIRPPDGSDPVSAELALSKVLSDAEMKTSTA